MSKELEEACRVIAEFMGDLWIEEDGEYRRGDIPVCDYSNSLDDLVPVWEKLEVITDFKFDIARSFREAKSEFILFNFTGSLKFKSYGETIQQAACLATAKAIMGLEK